MVGSLVKHTHTKAVALPTDESVLDRLVDRRDCLTTLAWGGQGDAGPMSCPRPILEQAQAHLPFPGTRSQ